MTDDRGGPAPEPEDELLGSEPPPVDATSSSEAPTADVAPAAAPALRGSTAKSNPIVERFTLRRALAVEAALGETARAKLERALTLGTQKAEAAETLWQNGHSVEGLRLGIESLDATLAALPIYAAAMGLDAGVDDEIPSSDPRAIEAVALRERGLSPKAIASVESARAAAHTAPLPEHERDIAPAHTPLWRDVMSAQHLVARALRDAGRTRRELRMTSIARIGGTVLIALLVIGGAALALRTPEGVFISASGVWGNAEAFLAEKAIDGRNDTWWLGPDGVESTLDVTIQPPRRVERIRLLNGTNAPHHDRGTRDYRLDVLANGRVVRSITGTLAHQTTGAPQFVEHEIGVDGVDQILFTALNHHAIGPGLAELQFD